MRTNIFSLFLFVALPGVILAGEAKILSMSGEVEVRPTREGQWMPAKEDLEVAEGGAVRTGVKGGALLLLPNKTKVWFRKSTTLEIEQRQTMASRLVLVFGKIKVRVPHLLRKEKFEVRTPAAVCAVRGTEFTMGATSEGKMDLQVLFGEVKLKFMIPPQKGSAEFNIPQGQGISSAESGQAAKPVMLTAKAELEALENWNPGLKPEERQKELQQKENDRAQVRAFARATANAENSVKSFLNVVKESDLEAGRTMSDVHGNVVRVDQRMVRPAADEIQFFNLVKRPVYNNDDTASLARGGFDYRGAQGIADRLDYMQMTMNFNKDLPQRIEEWPSFFNGNEINPDWASFVMANRTKSNEIFFIAQDYKYDVARDELVNNEGVLGLTVSADQNLLLAGVLKDDVNGSAAHKLNQITSLNIRNDTVSPGTYGDIEYLKDGATWTPLPPDQVTWAQKTTNAVAYEAKETGDNVTLWQYQADMYNVGNAGADYIWFAKENYVIGNSGNIKKVDDFTNTSSDPFTILKNSGLQTVMYIKKSQGNNPGAITTSALAYNDILAASQADQFSYDGGAAGIGTNIDLIFIPDLMVAAVQRMLPAITNLKD